MALISEEKIESSSKTSSKHSALAGIEQRACCSSSERVFFYEKLQIADYKFQLKNLESVIFQYVISTLTLPSIHPKLYLPTTHRV